MGYRVRLRVRTSKGITTDDNKMSFPLQGKDVVVSSQDGSSLKQAEWLIFNAHGFTSKSEAAQFGESLRHVVSIASLAVLLGIDVGNDRPTTWIDENFAKEMGIVRRDELLAPNVHGLVIVEENPQIRFPLVSLSGKVSVDAIKFQSALSETAILTIRNSENNCDSIYTAVRTLNQALMIQAPLGQMIVAISAIEELSKSEGWSKCQAKLIDHLAQLAAESDFCDLDEVLEVSEAIRKNLFRLSLRQGVHRLMDRTGLSAHKREWDKLYGVRSKIVHGNHGFSEAEQAEAAFKTIQLCTQIIVGAATKAEIALPSQMIGGGEVMKSHPG